MGILRTTLLASALALSSCATVKSQARMEYKGHPATHPKSKNDKIWYFIAGDLEYKLSTMNKVGLKLNRVPEALRDSVKHVYIVEPKKECEWKFAGACARKPDRIYVPDNVRYSTLIHEAAHTLTYMLEDTSLQERWKEAAGDVYMKHIKVEPYSVWDEDKKGGPRHGCVRPYGSRNVMEDIATFAEHAWTHPNDFRDLITEPGEKGHKKKSYDPRYQKKLDLLLQYDFLTVKQYDKITGKK